MARTRSGGKKAGGKAPRKAPVLRNVSDSKSSSSSKSSSGSKGSRKGARHGVCKRNTPKWQVPIGQFLKAGPSSQAFDLETPSTSTAPPWNAIEEKLIEDSEEMIIEEDGSEENGSVTDNSEDESKSTEIKNKGPQTEPITISLVSSDEEYEDMGGEVKIGNAEIFATVEDKEQFVEKGAAEDSNLNKNLGDQRKAEEELAPDPVEESLVEEAKADTFKAKDVEDAKEDVKEEIAPDPVEETNFVEEFEVNEVKEEVEDAEFNEEKRIEEFPVEDHDEQNMDVDESDPAKEEKVVEVDPKTD